MMRWRVLEANDVSQRRDTASSRVSRTYVVYIGAEVSHHKDDIAVGAWWQDRARGRSAGFAKPANAPEGEVPEQGRLERIVLEAVGECVNTLGAVHGGPEG